MAVELRGYYDESAEPESFEPIPAGFYQAQIIDAKKQEFSRRNDYGDCLALTWQITQGEYKGRLVFQRLNLWVYNMPKNNDLVVEIANSQFAQIRKATGKETPRDTDELLFIPCTIRVAVTQDKNQEYDPRNEVKAVKKADSGGQSASAPRQSFVASQARANAPASQGRANAPASTRPWRSPASEDTALEDDVPF